MKNLILVLLLFTLISCKKEKITEEPIVVAESIIGNWEASTLTITNKRTNEKKENATVSEQFTKVSFSKNNNTSLTKTVHGYSTTEYTGTYLIIDNQNIIMTLPKYGNPTFSIGQLTKNKLSLFYNEPDFLYEQKFVRK